MSTFGRWFLPRNRSNSIPTRQMLSDYLTTSANKPSLSPQNQQNPQDSTSSAGYHSLPTKPLLITSSFNDITYSFDTCDSSENDETPPDVSGGHSVANSRPPTPPSTTTDVNKPQNHDYNNNQQSPPSPQQFSNSVHYSYEQGNYPHDAQPTRHPKTCPRKIPPKRRPTPFVEDHYYDDNDQEEYKTAYHRRDGGFETTSAMDDHQISYTNGYNNDPYDAEVRKLKTEIKRLEKKHKEHERHILDTQQQLENLIISRSYESTFYSGGASHYPPPNVDSHHYHSQSLNERQQQQQQQQQHPSYWYTTPYDTEYYYTNNSYPNKSTSFHPTSEEPYDYSTLQKSNNSNASTSRHYEMNDSYQYGYNPPAYVSSSDKNYYYQLQQRQHQLQYHRHQYLKRQGFSPPSKTDNNKRWSTC